MISDKQIEIFQGDNNRVEVQLHSDSLWVSQNQMAELFATSPDNISLHLRNIYAEKELDEGATTEDSSVVADSLSSAS